MSEFSGKTDDPVRNKIQEALFKSIGNDSTRPRSIELAIRTELALYERCGKRNDGIYKTHSKELMRDLKDEKGGFELNRKLLTGELPPEKWVAQKIPQKLPEFVSKEEEKKKRDAEKAKQAEAAAPAAIPSVITSQNNATTKKDSDMDVEPQSAESKSKTDESSYYFFKSTDPETAKKYAPKKLDGPVTKAEEEQISQQGLSKWNKGATWEEKDRSKWAKGHFKELLDSLSLAPLADGKLAMKAWTVTAEASIVFVRGKKRAGYEISGTADFAGEFQGEQVEGTVKIPKIDNTDVSDDDYEISLSFKKGFGTPRDVIKKALKNAEKDIRKLVHQFEADLKALI